MHQNNLITRILALACLIVHMPGFGTTMADDVKTPMALDDVKSSIVALKAETAKLGSPKVSFTSAKPRPPMTMLTLS